MEPDVPAEHSSRIRRAVARSRRQETIMIRKFLALFLVTGSLALGACNTIEGAGRDIESVGETVADAAD
jgi:predicted small secreted protein